MTDAIYDTIGEDMCRRMRNWARWWDASINGGALPCCLTACELGVRIDRYREAQSPLLFGEGADTEAALREVPARYQQVMRKFWLHEGKSLRWNARQRRIDHHTLRLWLIEGHRILRQIIDRKTEFLHLRWSEIKALRAGA